MGVELKGFLYLIERARPGGSIGNDGDISGPKGLKLSSRIWKLFLRSRSFRQSKPIREAATQSTATGFVPASTTPQGLGVGRHGSVAFAADNAINHGEITQRLFARLPPAVEKERHLFRSSTMRQQVSLPCQLPERTTFCVSPKMRRPTFFMGTNKREAVGRPLSQRLAVPIQERSSRDFVVAAGN